MADQDFRVKNGLQVGVGGTVLTADIGGKVGINSTSPTATLDIQGTIKSSGTITAPTFAGTATTANNLSNAANITTGTISADRLSGNYNISISGSVSGETISIGTVTASNNLNVGSGNTGVFATGGGNLRVSGISTLGITSATNLTSQQLNVSGISTLGITSATNLTSQQLNVSGISTLGITSATNLTSQQLNVSGISTLGITSATNLTSQQLNVSGISTLGVTSTTNLTSQQLNVSGISTLGITSATNLTSQQLNVSGISTLGVVTSGNIYSTGIVTASQLSTGSSGIGINTDTISGPSIIYIDPSPVGVGTTSGIVRIRGDLYVDGTQFIVNSTTIELADFNVGIATTVGTNALLDGAGIGIGSANNRKTFTYSSSPSDSLKSSENLDIASGKVYKVAGTEVLSSTQLTVANINATGISTLGITSATNLTSQQLNVSGISTLGITSATNLTSQQLNVSGISTLGTVKISSGIITAASGVVTYFGDGSQLTGVSVSKWIETSAGIHTLSNVGIGTTNPTSKLHVVGDVLVTGVVTATQLQVTGVSKFTNGPVLIGSGTSTGTANQRLQVTGDAYVSGSVGIGTTYSINGYELDVNGRIHTTNDIDLDSTTGALNLTGRPNINVGANNPIVNISHPNGSYLYSLYGWQDTGNDRVFQQLNDSTDFFTALGDDSQFTIGASAGVLDGSAYSFKVGIGAETSLYHNHSEKLTTTTQGILVTGLTSTTTLNVGTGGTVITTTAAGLVGIGTTNPIGTLEVVGSVVADGSDIRNLPRTQLVSYASASDISNSALSIAGVSTYTLVGSFSTTYEFSYSGPAISADGGTIIVGDWLANSLGGDGAVYVYDRVGAGSSIVQVGILTNGSFGSGTNDTFGYSVATSADAKTIAVGAISDELSGAGNYGLVYIFDRVGVGSASTFNRVGILTGSFASATNEFGERLIVSGNGKTIVVGAPTDELSGTTGNGLVYVFDRIGNSFRQVGVLNGSLALNANDRFGESVATSYDGKTIIVGARDDEQTGSGSGSGVVYVFDRVGLGTSFNQVGILTGSLASTANDSFGSSVATSADGKTIIVGAELDETGATLSTGVVYVFDRVGNIFNQVGILTSSVSNALDRFGYSVATSADGKTIASYSGSYNYVTIYKREGNSFNEVTRVSYAGNSVEQQKISLTADGKTLILSNEQGIYVYDEVKDTYLYSGPTGNIGIGTSNPTSKLHVVGDVLVSGVSTTGNISVSDGKILSFLGGTSIFSNSQITIAARNSSANLYELFAYDVTSGTDYVLELIKTATDRQFLLGNNREFVVAYDPSSYPADSFNYAFKVKIGAETSLYHNQSEKLTTTTQGILVTGLTSTTTLNVGTGGTVITTTAAGLVGIGTTNPTSKLDVRGAINVGGAVSITAARDSGSNDVIYFNPLNESKVSIGINTTLNWASISNLPDVAFVADSSIFGTPKIGIANPTETDPHYQLYAAYATGTVTYGYVRQSLNNASYAIALNGSSAFSVGDRDSLASSKTSNFNSSNEAFVVILDGSTSLFHNKSKKFETSGVGVTVYGNLNVGTGGTVITTTAAGLVGIGTTNPTSKLHVVGDARVGINTSQGVILTSANGSKYRLIVDNSGNLSTVSVT